MFITKFKKIRTKGKQLFLNIKLDTGFNDPVGIKEELINELKLEPCGITVISTQ